MVSMRGDLKLDSAGNACTTEDSMAKEAGTGTEEMRQDDAMRGDSNTAPATTDNNMPRQTGPGIEQVGHGDAQDGDFMKAAANGEQQMFSPTELPGMPIRVRKKK